MIPQSGGMKQYQEEKDMKKIVTTEAPAAIGPYSQGMVFGDMVFSSGQIPVIPATGEVAGATIAEPAEQSCKNVGAVLAAGGASSRGRRRDAAGCDQDHLFLSQYG